MEHLLWRDYPDNIICPLWHHNLVFMVVIPHCHMTYFMNQYNINNVTCCVEATIITTAIKIHNYFIQTILMENIQKYSKITSQDKN